MIILRQKNYGALPYIGGYVAGSIPGSIIGSKIGDKIKRKPNANEIHRLEKTIEYNKEDIAHLKSGKSIKDLLYDKNGNFKDRGDWKVDPDIEWIASKYDGGKDYNPDEYNIKHLDKPEIKKKIIAELEKQNKEKSEKLKNKSKKTETYASKGSGIGGFIGGLAGIAGVGYLRRNK